MTRTSVGTKLYVSVLAVFIAFTACFIVFQHAREKQYKVDTLNIKLQAYNKALDEFLHEKGGFTEEQMDTYVSHHYMPSLRVTLIDRDGRVVYDSRLKDYSRLSNHSSRPEVMEARARGMGSVVDRNSPTFHNDFFYSATLSSGSSGMVIRSALPYDNDLTKSLQAEIHYIWFALGAMLILTVILYRFTSRLSDNIKRLRTFAERADHNESLDTEDLLGFPADELGEIAERIIKIYKRLQTTRQEQDLLKRQLTQNIAHELKTPVASIQGYLETIIENKGISNDMRDHFISSCFAQCRRLSSLLQDISTLNRMDDAPHLMSKERVDVSAMVANIVVDTALQRQERNMNFDNRLPENIIIYGNSSLLYGIFRNLTDNAIAYAGNGTAITLEADSEQDSLTCETVWHFTFKDNGVGVPAEHLPRLFERFYRVDKGRSRKMGGTGLGLAIVKNAVHMHSGTISVRQNEGGGLLFDFTLRSVAVSDM